MFTTSPAGQKAGARVLTALTPNNHLKISISSAVDTDEALLEAAERGFLSIFKSVSLFLKSAGTIEFHMLGAFLPTTHSNSARQDMIRRRKSERRHRAPLQHIA